MKARKGTRRDALMEWLACGERGISSETIAREILGFAHSRKWGPGHPRDPDDLRRCYLLVKGVPPTKAEWQRIAALSDGWAALVPHWDELISLLEEELERPDRRAPKTYARMQEILRDQ